MTPVSPLVNRQDQLGRARSGLQMNPVRTVLFLLLFMPLSTAGQGIGTLTLLEGSASVIRGANVGPAVEGMRLRQGDIIENSEPGFVQLEFLDGSIVALGPASRLYISQIGTRGGKASGATLILLSGWLKAESGSVARMSRYDSPLLGASTGNGTLLFHATGNACDIFIESGSAMVAEVSREGIWHQQQSGKAGQFISRRAGKSLVFLARPSSEFVDSMPHPFKDTLPPHPLKPREGKAGRPVSYGDVQIWLTMPLAWRGSFVTRFQSRLNDPEFRKQVEAHLAELPEWDPILHPKKYQPENPVAPVHQSNTPQVRN